MISHWSDSNIAELVDDFQTQAKDLCPLHDHVTRVVANLDVLVDRFAGYATPEKATFDLAPVIDCFCISTSAGSPRTALRIGCKALPSSISAWVWLDLPASKRSATIGADDSP